MVRATGARASVVRQSLRLRTGCTNLRPSKSCLQGLAGQRVAHRDRHGVRLELGALGNLLGERERVGGELAYRWHVVPEPEHGVGLAEQDLTLANERQLPPDASASSNARNAGSQLVRRDDNSRRKMQNVRGDSSAVPGSLA